MTKKRRHLTIMIVWAALLAVAVGVFWDRLFSPGGDKSAADASSEGYPRSLRGTGQPVQSDADPPLMRLHQALRAKNPAYNGRGQFRMTAGRITIADLSGTGIADASPLKELPLEALDLSGNPIADLSSLRGMPLQRLALEATEVTVLSPLRGMPLKELYLNRARVEDLSPLAGMPLNVLNLYETNVKDISPLQGMPIKFLWLNATKVSDISPIAGCPLVSLTLERTPVSDLSPLAGTDLKRLHVGESDVTDLTPLKGARLDRLVFTPGRITKGLAVVRNMKSIREIGTTLDGLMSPNRFWTAYDEDKLR